MKLPVEQRMKLIREEVARRGLPPDRIPPGAGVNTPHWLDYIERALRNAHESDHPRVEAASAA